MTWSDRLTRLAGRLPLRVTTATALLLLFVPTLALWRLPRPRAEGLGRLMTQAALLQSFPGAPSRPVPRLWEERLGPATATRLWQQQRRLWWQFWGRQGDGDAYLVLPMPRPMLTGALPMPAHSVAVDDLLVVAADPLSHRLLSDQLRQQPRERRGLEQRCLARLERDQAAFWSPVALGVMAGPLAPLLQNFQEGCLSLDLQAGTLALLGEAAATEALLAEGPPSLSPIEQEQAATELARTAAAAAPGSDQLLLLEGRTLDVLLQDLLNRQLIRDPLASRYGVSSADLGRLRRTPFRLSLRRFSSGPFQAGLSLHLAPGADRRSWAQFLAALRQRLEQDGLSDAAPQRGSEALPSSRWRREDGEVVGGWRWLSRQGAAPELLLFLGPEPPAAALAAASPLPAGSATPLLTLVMQPRQLASLGLLPSALPTPLLQAPQLGVVARDGGSTPKARSGSARSVSALWGRLQLKTLTQEPPGQPVAPLPPKPQSQP